VADDDPRCGPSSFQAFGGEDLGAAARKRAQQERSRAAWQAQQSEERSVKDQQQSYEAYLAWVVRRSKTVPSHVSTSPTT
jgi:RIB43A